jgi:uncharacterized membrane protein YkvA (DUF1232 family)
MNSEQDYKAQEAQVGNGFWQKLMPLIGKLPFAHDLVAAYYCAFDKETGFKTKAILMGALAYFVLPIDAIPDFLPLVGFTDDAAVLAAAIASVKANLKPEHHMAAKQALVERLEAR